MRAVQWAYVAARKLWLLLADCGGLLLHTIGRSLLFQVDMYVLLHRVCI